MLHSKADISGANSGVAGTLSSGMVNLILCLTAPLLLASAAGTELEPSSDVYGYTKQSSMARTAVVAGPTFVPKLPHASSQATERHLPSTVALATLSAELPFYDVGYSATAISSSASRPRTQVTSNIVVFPTPVSTSEKESIPGFTGNHNRHIASVRTISIPDSPVTESRHAAVEPKSKAYESITSTAPNVSKTVLQRMPSSSIESSMSSKQTDRSRLAFQHHVEHMEYDTAPSYVIAYPLPTVELEATKAKPTRLSTLDPEAKDSVRFAPEDEPSLLPCIRAEDVCPSYEFQIAFNTTETHLWRNVHRLQALLSAFFDETNCTAVGRTAVVIGAPHVFGWTNTSAAGSPCERQLTDVLLSKMALPSGKPRPAFAAHFAPWVSVVSARKLHCRSCCTRRSADRLQTGLVVALGALVAVNLACMCVLLMANIKRKRIADDGQQRDSPDDLKARNPVVLIGESRTTAQCNGQATYYNLAFADEVPAAEPPQYTRSPSDLASDTNDRASASDRALTSSSTASPMRIHNSAGTVSV